MAPPPTEEQLLRGSGETEVYHLAAHGDGYPSACTDPPADLGGPAIENMESHDQQAPMFTDQLYCYTSEIVSTQEGRDGQEDIDEHDAQSDDEEGSDHDKGSDGEEDMDEYDAQSDDNGGSDYEEYSYECSEQMICDSETNCPVENYSKEEAEEIVARSLENFTRQFDDCLNLRKEILARGDKNARLPAYPLEVLPVVTDLCIKKGFCYHREYMTHDISTTASYLGYHRPKVMLQVFSLRLASYASYPISVYGTFAVRDDLEPLRNLVVNIPRDDAVTVEQDAFTLPLCSPCRGMHVLDHALLDVDLWVKKEGDESADKQLLSAYVEIYVHSRFDRMRRGQILGDRCSLELKYMFLSPSIEAVIQVCANVDHPHHLRFTAFSSGFDHEILLFDDKFVGNGNLNQHVVVVKQKGKLNICLKVEEEVFQWTFQDGVVGTVSSPDDSVFKYGQFIVRVLFAPKNVQPRTRMPVWSRMPVFA